MADLAAADNHAASLVEQIQKKEDERGVLAASNAVLQDQYLGKLESIDQKQATLESWKREIDAKQNENDFLRKRISGERMRFQRIIAERQQISDHLKQHKAEAEQLIMCLTETASALASVFGQKVDVYSPAQVGKRAALVEQLLARVIAQEPWEETESGLLADMSPEEFCNLKQQLELSEEHVNNLQQQVDGTRLEVDTVREQGVEMQKSATERANAYHHLCANVASLQQRLSGATCTKCMQNVFQTEDESEKDC